MKLLDVLALLTGVFSLTTMLFLHRFYAALAVGLILTLHGNTLRKRYLP